MTVAAGQFRSIGSVLRGLVTAVAIACAAMLASSGAAMSRDLTDAERASLAKTVESFDAAMRNGDYGRVVDTIPPKMMQHMADGAGMPVDQLRQMVIDMSAAAMAGGVLISFSMDIAKTEYQALADGTPYALIPTETILRLDPAKDDKMAARSMTLGLLDGAEWYLVRVNEAQQVVILRQVYPGFATVEFPAGTMEPVE